VLEGQSTPNPLDMVSVQPLRDAASEPASAVRARESRWCAGASRTL